MDQLIRAQTRFGVEGTRASPDDCIQSEGVCHQATAATKYTPNVSKTFKGFLTYYSRNTDLLCAKQCQVTTAKGFTPNVCIVQNNDTENEAFPFEI